MSECQSLSCVQLFVTPQTAAHQAPLSMEFSRQEYWTGQPFPSPGDLPNPGIKLRSPTLHTDSLPSELPGKTNKNYNFLKYQDQYYLLPIFGIFQHLIFIYFGFKLTLKVGFYKYFLKSQTQFSFYLVKTPWKKQNWSHIPKTIMICYYLNFQVFLFLNCGSIASIQFNQHCIKLQFNS